MLIIFTHHFTVEHCSNLTVIVTIVNSFVAQYTVRLLQIYFKLITNVKSISPKVTLCNSYPDRYKLKRRDLYGD